MKHDKMLAMKNKKSAEKNIPLKGSESEKTVRQEEHSRAWKGASLAGVSRVRGRVEEVTL